MCMLPHPKGDPGGAQPQEKDHSSWICCSQAKCQQSGVSSRSPCRHRGDPEGGVCSGISSQLLCRRTAQVISETCFMLHVAGFMMQMWCIHCYVVYNNYYMCLYIIFDIIFNFQYAQ